MTLRLVFNNKILTLASGKLGSAGLFRIKMIKARLARNYLPILGDF